MIDVERLGGVPLGQVAAVHAAVAEGFGLPEVLSVEQLTDGVWLLAEPLWKQRLVSDPITFQQYRALLMAEQDRLARPVVPLDEDVDAWVQFLAAYSAHDDPFSLLSSSGLGVNDMARLGRRWARRMKEQPRVAKSAASAAGKLEGKDVAMPAIAIGERSLGPSVHAGGYQAESSPDAGAAAHVEVPVFGLAEYAALSAELSLATAAHQRRDVLSRFALGREQAESIEAAWRALLDSDRELMSDFRALVSHHRQRARLGKHAAQRRPITRPIQAVPRRATPAARGPAFTALPKGPPFVPPVGRARPSPTPALLDETAPLMRAPLFMEATPFRGAISRLPPARPITRVDSVDATGDVIPALLEEPALPFGSVDETAFLTSSIVFDDPLPFADVNDTAVTVKAFQHESVLPFSGSVTSVSIEATGWSASRALGTTIGLDVSLLGDTVLPFDAFALWEDVEEIEEPTARMQAKRASQANPEPVSGKQAPAPESVTKVTREVSELDATTLIGALHVGDLGLEDSDDAETLAEEPLPTLTIEQYASLHAELLVHPEWADTIRQRYHLGDEAAQRRLDAAWQHRFTTWPDERASFQYKLAEYQRWLRSRESDASRA